MRVREQTFAIFVLKINGAPIATKLVAYNTRILDWIITAFDAEWGRYSPDRSWMNNCVQWAFENSIEIDFGPGSVPYKTLWSNNNAITTVSYRFSGSLLGTLAMQAGNGRRQMARLSQTATRAIPSQFRERRSPRYAGAVAAE